MMPALSMRRPTPTLPPSQRRTPGRSAALVACVCALVRCGDASVTQLLVVVSTAPAEGLPVEAVEVEVQSEDARTSWGRARFPLVGSVDGRFSLPLSFGVAPQGTDAGLLRVTARARLREGATPSTLEASALTRFVAGQKLLLPLVLDYRCSLHPPCAPGLSCASQECAPELRPPETLRALRPDEAPPATGSACTRPAEACIDRCDEGTRAPVTRFVNPAGQSALSLTPDTPPCCGGQAVAAREVFFVSPAARPDLLPLYICRATDGAVLYSLRARCEGYAFNDGVLGYILSPATPGRCGTVPLYRLHNPRTADRYYTTRVDERDGLLRQGYISEGLVGHVWPPPAPPSDPIGCADGTREAFTDRAAFPDIAACAGPWSVAGIFPAVPPSPAAPCATLGNSSTQAPTDGAGCTASNLCATGWHVCRGGEVLPRTDNRGCAATRFPASTFFAASVSGPGCFRCALPAYTVTGARCTNTSCADDCRPSTCALDCQASDDLNNDLFGCGTLGYEAPTACDGLDRTPGDRCETLPGTPWRCGGPTDESRAVTKPGSGNGGVLCCRDGV